MPAELTFPGVYVEESNGAHPIAGVPTSITAFAGWSEKGPADVAERITSWKKFEEIFGGLDSRSLLGYSVRHYFDNGGSEARIIRIGSAEADPLVPNTEQFEEALLPADQQGGLYTLDSSDGVNLLCVPGETNPSVIARLQKFCFDRRAFLIIDCPADATFNDMQVGLASIAGDEAINSAFYFPWILAPDPLQNNSVREFPPCGFLAGVYARTDESDGIWKAPAGTEASLKGASGFTSNNKLNQQQNGVLNAKAINCIRSFQTDSPVVWGSRTVHGSDQFGSEWKYIPVRRTALFIEASVYQGLDWVVFEPNDEPLWAKIRLNVGDFMHQLFQQGAFQGTTPKEAYFVKCDRDTITQNDIDQGSVNILVGFAPLKPAEFVILKFHITTMTKEKKTKGGILVNANRFDPYKNFKFRVTWSHRDESDDDVEVESVIEQLQEQLATGQAGMSAVFAGAKGSGRSLTAEVIANRLEKELVCVDLSRITSKYIGEAEKNIKEVFENAARGGAILFFDEADALFGKRSEVRDSHDRYANLEVAYLLRSLEDHPGLAILATNLKENIDTAFLRRIRFSIDFPPPRE